MCIMSVVYILIKVGEFSVILSDCNIHFMRGNANLLKPLTLSKKLNWWLFKTRFIVGDIVRMIYYDDFTMSVTLDG